jgi:hypothetical protein
VSTEERVSGGGNEGRDGKISNQRALVAAVLYHVCRQHHVDHLLRMLSREVTDTRSSSTVLQSITRGSSPDTHHGASKNPHGNGRYTSGIADGGPHLLVSLRREED